MKYARLTTTSKMCLFVLLSFFGILFLSYPAYSYEGIAQTKSGQRLEVMERYLSWIDTGQYGKFDGELGQKALVNFKPFLTVSLEGGNSCLKSSGPQEMSFTARIQSFFLRLIPGFDKTLQDSAGRKLSECKKHIKDNYKTAKKYNRLLKYLQIEEGKPNICVKADLGVGNALKARGFNPTKVDLKDPKKQGITPSFPVYLCTGEDGKKKVRVVDGSGTRLRLSEEDSKRNELKVENLPAEQSVETLLKKLGLK